MIYYCNPCRESRQPHNLGNRLRSELRWKRRVFLRSWDVFLEVVPGAGGAFLELILCECSPEVVPRHPENIRGSHFCVNVLRRVVPHTGRTFLERVSVCMFSGGWFQTPGEHSRNTFLRGCSPEGGSGRPENITGTVNVLRNQFH